MFRTASGRILLLGGTLLIVGVMLQVSRERMQHQAATGTAADATAGVPAGLDDGAPAGVADGGGAGTGVSDMARPVADRQALVAGLFQGALLNAKDRTDFAEGASYLRLLHHVHAMPPADFSSRVTGRLDPVGALADPDLWRGEFVRMRGLLGGMSAIKLRDADPDLQDVYRGYVGQPDGTEVVLFDSVEPPPDVTVKRDVLDIEGIFYRVVRYENTKGEMREAPYLIVRNLSVYAPHDARQSTASLVLKLAGVVAGSLFVAFLLLRMAGRRRPPTGRPGRAGGPGSAGFREAFEARIREDHRPPRDRPRPA